MMMDVNKKTNHNYSGEKAHTSTFATNPLVHIYQKEKIATKHRWCERALLIYLFAQGLDYSRKVQKTKNKVGYADSTKSLPQ
jgi:hypothetical protein